MYEKTADKTRRTFFFEMDASQMPATIKAGCYILAIYKISVSRVIFEKRVVSDSLYPILYDLQHQTIIDNHDLAEEFMGKAQINGRYALLREDMRIPTEIIDDIEYDFKEVIDEYVEEYYNDQLMRINNNKKMRLQQTLQYFDTRIRNLQHNINTQEAIQENATILKDEATASRAERTLRLQRGQMQALLQRKDDDIEKINRDVQLRVTDEVKSLNLVKIV